MKPLTFDLSTIPTPRDNDKRFGSAIIKIAQTVASTHLVDPIAFLEIGIPSCLAMTQVFVEVIPNDQPTLSLPQQYVLRAGLLKAFGLISSVYQQMVSEQMGIPLTMECECGVVYVKFPDKTDYADTTECDCGRVLHESSLKPHQPPTINIIVK